METEIQGKHRENKKLKKEIAFISIQLKGTLGLFLYGGLIHEIHHVIKSRYKAVMSRHEKKNYKFWTAQKKENKVSKPGLLKCIVYNFLSNNLTQGEHETSSYGLDHHIQTKINRNNIKTGFESFFQNLLYNLSDVPENEISKMKTKILNTFEKYCHVKVPYKQRKIISNLSNSKDIVILKQDKGRGVVIMDQRNYTENCMSSLSSNQFVHIMNDPKKSLESKVQRTLRKIKSKLSEQNYKKLYSTRFCPGKFHGTAKIHKLSVNGCINDLPI